MNDFTLNGVRPEYKEYNVHSVSPGYFPSTSWIRKKDTKSYSYTRNKSPNYSEFEECICKMYGTEITVLCSSGLEAISCIFNALYDTGVDNYVMFIDKELYCQTESLIDDFQVKYKRIGLIVKYFDFCNITDIDNAFIEYKPNLIFCESCSNPSGRVPDLSYIAAKKDTTCDFIVDNSWLSVQFNPLKYGADIVIESISKYIGGGDIIGGIITGNCPIEKIKLHANKNGIRMSHHDAYMATIACETVGLRIRTAGKLAYDIAKYMESNTRITKVMYPILESNPSYVNAIKMKIGYPGVIYFHFNGVSKKEGVKILSSCKNILYATSYGKSISLFDYNPKEETINDKKGIWVRFAIGYTQSSEELKEVIDNLFK